MLIRFVAVYAADRIFIFESFAPIRQYHMGGINIGTIREHEFFK